MSAELHRTLDGPVFDTLTAVNHPELRGGRLDLVAQQYERGLKSYPHVDRFFVWLASLDDGRPPDVLFYDRVNRFRPDPALGRAVLQLAKDHSGAQQIYVAARGVGVDARYEVLLRLFWTDARRLEYFAVLGFVVDPTTMRDRLFAAQTFSNLAPLLTRRGGDVPLRLRVTDEDGAVVYGAAASGGPTGKVTFPMLFYPAAEIQGRMSTRLEPRLWTIEVNAPPASKSVSSIVQAYGLTALSLLLMLAALGLTVQAHRRSVELSRMQSEFVAHVSHQLKTPLSLLSAATETLQMDRVRSPERLREYLATIHAEAARLSLLVQRVLEFSRVQQRRSYEFETVDLAALVKETVDAFAHSLSSQHFTFDVQHDGSSPAVIADSAALEQVLVNLLDNAVKYSAENKNITVRVHSSRGEAIVDVVDRGIGIDAADQPRIFERFYRPSSTRQRPGFGLSLSLVRELMQAHHGRVEFTSELGTGSTFRFVLPASEEAHEQSSRSPDRGRTADARHAHRQPRVRWLSGDGGRVG